MRRRLVFLVLISLVSIGYGSALQIDTIADEYTIGDTLVVSGTTNLAAGNELIITIQSLAFEPTAKDMPAEFAGISGMTRVIEENGVNTWSFPVDTSGFVTGEYHLLVESIDVDVRAVETFRMKEGIPRTPDPIQMTPEERETPPAPTEPEPAKTPGFGIMALITAVALALICRKR